MLASETKTKICQLICAAWRGVDAIYLFGSAVSGSSHESSDIDLAVLSSQAISGEHAFSLKGQLSALLLKDVDLIALREADTVTQAQVVSTGEVLLQQSPSEVAQYETTVFSMYAQLNLERQGIISDILRSGKVYG